MTQFVYYFIIPQTGFTLWSSYSLTKEWAGWLC